MEHTILKFYEKVGFPSDFVKAKMEMFKRHPDIMEEFAHWIATGEYKSDGVCVENYTAKQLSDQFEYMKGEGAFVMLMELREDPADALSSIKDGLKFL